MNETQKIHDIAQKKSNVIIVHSPSGMSFHLTEQLYLPINTGVFPEILMYDDEFAENTGIIFGKIRVAFCKWLIYNERVIRKLIYL